MRPVIKVAAAASTLLAALGTPAAFGQATPARANPPAQGAPVPSGWVVTGDGWKAYKVSRDTATAHSGSASAHIAFESGPGVTWPDPLKGPWAALTQTMDAKPWLGKRLRMTAWVKAADVIWASVWMRVDNAERPLMFDNMAGRSLTGDVDWMRADVVLDVPAEAKTISYGSLIISQGQMWVDDFSFDAVPGETHSTNLMVPSTENLPPSKRAWAPDPLDADKRRPISESLATPQNLGFEAQ